jgi:lysophospholipase L1-like esterase
MRLNRKAYTMAALALSMGAVAAWAQPAPPTPASAPAAAPAPVGLNPADVRAAETRLHDDWAWLGRYQAADQALIASGVRPDVVFMGDSITQGWPDKTPAYFRPGLVGRGISGQTSPQMLVRFRQDVIDLKPRAVHIMMGTNDIASNTGPMTLEQTEANFQTLTELALAHHIQVILASIPPSAGFPWRPGLETALKIQTLNTWIKAYAARVGAIYADYTSVLDNGAGGMKPGLSYDGVHPTAAGYLAMAPVTDKAIAEALAR